MFTIEERFTYVEDIRIKFSIIFNEFEDILLRHSIPLEGCKQARHDRYKIHKKIFFFTNTGYCASQNPKFYGYKFYAVCS